MVKSIASVFFAANLLSSTAFAAPGIPNRFYGSVSFNDGSAPDGTLVDARIEGITVAETTTHDGRYGYAPNVFDVTAPNGNRAGKTISFFVNGIDTGNSAVFVKGAFTQLDLFVNSNANAVHGNTGNPPPAANVGGGSNAPPASAPDKPCSPLWSCSEWSICLNSVQTRSCKDLNNCKISSDTPSIIQNCTTPIQPEEKSTTSNIEPDKESLPDNTPTGFFISTTAVKNVIFVILAISVLVAIYRKQGLRVRRSVCIRLCHQVVC